MVVGPYNTIYVTCWAKHTSDLAGARVGVWVGGRSPSIIVGFFSQRPFFPRLVQGAVLNEERADGYYAEATACVRVSCAIWIGSGSLMLQKIANSPPLPWHFVGISGGGKVVRCLGH